MHENEATTHEAKNEAKANNYETENEVEAVKCLEDLTSLHALSLHSALIFRSLSCIRR